MIEEDVYAVLAANPTLAVLVEDRIYPMLLPQGEQRPAIVYQRVSSVPQNVLTGPASLDQVRLQIDCWSVSYTTTKTLAWSLRVALETAASIKATLQVEQDLYEPDTRLYRVTADYLLWQRN